MKRVYIILLVVSALFACEKQDAGNGSNGGEIKFELGISADTKVSGNLFEMGDEVSLYAVEYNSDEKPELQIGGNFLNNERLAKGDNGWKSSRTIYWSSKPCDFYALYPYQNLISVEEQPIQVATDQNSLVEGSNMDGYEASDLLYAKAEDVERNDGPVKLEFSHIMSKCVVNIVKGEKFEGEIPDDIVTHIYNTTTTGLLNFIKGTIAKKDNDIKETITMKKLSNTKFEAVLIPQNIERRTPLIEVTMGGIAYLMEYSLSFKPGFVHTINLIVNTSPDQEKIEISIDPEIEGMD